MTGDGTAGGCFVQICVKKHRGRSGWKLKRKGHYNDGNLPAAEKKRRCKKLIAPMEAEDDRIGSDVEVSR